MDERYSGGESSACDTATDPNLELARRFRRLTPQMLRDVESILQRMEVANQAERKDEQVLKTINRGSFVVEQLTEDNVDEVFRYHPWDSQQQRAGAIVVEALVAAAKAILRNVPPCPDRTVALRKLRELRMDANSAITHRGRF